MIHHLIPSFSLTTKLTAKRRRSTTTRRKMAGKRKRITDGSSSKNRNGDEPDNRIKITLRDLESDPDSSDDDLFNNAKIKVKTPTGKTMSYKVKRSDTIGSIKVKVQEDEPIPFDQQELIFNGIALKDMDTVANLRIKKKATLTLLRKSTGLITIHIETQIDRLTVALKPSDTIDKIKSRSVLGCYDPGKLIFNDVVLKGNGTLEDFNIVDGSVLYYVYKEAKKIKLFVNNSVTGKTVAVRVNPLHTIGALKVYLEDDVDIRYDEQVLVYNNVVLGDSATLFDFNITRKSTIKVMYRPREFEEFMEIFVKTVVGREIIALDVKPYDTIGDIKPMIKNMLNIPCDEQELIYNEMVIHDVHSLADFHIIDGSTLTLMRVSWGFISITIKSKSDGETTTVNVRPSDTILNLKSKFYDKAKFPVPSNQRLFFNGKQLEDSATLAHYHISEDSTVYFDVKPLFG